MIGAFVLLGVGLIAAGAVAAATRAPVSLLIGALLALSGIALAVSGCLQQRCSTAIGDCADHVTTAHGTIASVGLSLLLVAALVASIRARRWVAIGLAGVAALVTIVWLTGHGWSVAGLMERTVVLTLSGAVALSIDHLDEWSARAARIEAPARRQSSSI